jgi:hypothetical protein
MTEQPPRTDRPGRRRRTALASLAAACLAVLAWAAPALAAPGEYEYILCANPDTGQPAAPADKAFPEGVQMTRVAHPNQQGLSLVQRCGTAASPATGMVITPLGTYTLPQNAVTEFTFTLPADLEFRGASLWLRTQTRGGMLAVVSRTASDWIYALPHYYVCEEPGWGCTGTGDPWSPFSPANRFEVGSGHDGMPNGFKWYLACSWWTCDVSDATTVFQLFGGKVRIGDNGTPTGAVGVGGLAADEVLRGVEELTFTAADAQSGVYRFRLIVDGEPRPWQLVDPASASCRDMSPQTGHDYEFNRIRPCPMSVAATASLDTRTVAEGTHRFRLQVEDASGRAITLLDREALVDNVQPPAAVTPPSVSGVPRRGNNLVASGGTWDNGGAPGEPDIAYRWERCHRDGHACAAIDGATAPVYTVGDADLNRRLRVVAIARNGEGTTEAASALTEVVTREDGTLPPDNNGRDDDGDGEVDEPGEEPPPPPPPGSGALDPEPTPGGRTPTGADARPGGGSGPSGGGTSASAASQSVLNGTGASPQARLSAGFSDGRTRATLAYGRTITVRGRLVDDAGRPIQDAIVEVLETPARSGARAAAGRSAVTAADGSFVHRADGRAGSRTLTFLYRYERGGPVVARADLRLTVRAGVTLSVSLKGSVARYSGRVRAGFLPRGGKLVILQGRAKGGSWQTFASRRASRNGVFTGRYRLKVRRPGKQLQFRARVLTESGWNFASATSKTVTRRVR